jgi:hypothetical protein
VLVGCGGERTITTSDGQEVTVSGDAEEFEMAINEPSGQTANIRVSDQGVDIPAGWPDDVPVLTEAKVVAATTTTSGQMMAMESGQPPKSVFAFYLEQLAASGWEIKIKTETTESILISAIKGERSANVMSSKDDGKTVVNVMVSSK